VIWSKAVLDAKVEDATAKEKIQRESARRRVERYPLARGENKEKVRDSFPGLKEKKREIVEKKTGRNVGGENQASTFEGKPGDHSRRSGLCPPDLFRAQGKKLNYSLVSAIRRKDAWSVHEEKPRIHAKGNPPSSTIPS